MENKPKGALSQISRVVDSAIDWIIVIMFASLIVSCVTQVFMRSILNDSPPWTEELARYSFMYVNFIGAVICVREKSHARVTVILDALSGMARKALEVIADLETLFVSYVMIHYGTMSVIQVAAQRSPAMRICMSFVYFCIPLAGVFIAAEAILSLYRNIRAKKEEAEE